MWGCFERAGGLDIALAEVKEGNSGESGRGVVVRGGQRAIVGIVIDTPKSIGLYVYRRMFNPRGVWGEKA